MGHSEEPPRLMGVYDRAGHGGWYAGKGGRPEMPVIVFVPGLGQPARSFWTPSELYGQNEMYVRAAAAGYRTAFAGFAAEKEKPMDMWNNGRILAKELEEICRHFGTPSVIAAAHSKGGVDVETAAVYYGAAPYLSAIYTLSTPHWGSELADLAYSSAGFPLGERMGVHSDGCYVMQTGYMATYRQKTDAVPMPVPLFNFAGDGSGPVLSRIWAGEHILSLWGKNDGVVTVKSAQSPQGRPAGTLALNHIQMQSGQYIWPFLEAAVSGRQPVPVPVSPASAGSSGQTPDGLVLRGGDLTDGVNDPFAVDSAAETFEICLMAAGGEPGGRFSLVSPSGRSFPLRQTKETGGAQIDSLAVPSPEPGEWRLRGPKGGGSYLASVRFLKNARPEISPPEKLGRRAVHKIRKVLRISRTLPHRRELVYEGEEKDGRDAAAYAKKDGIYSVESVLRGELDDGSPYERDTFWQMPRFSGRF